MQLKTVTHACKGLKVACACASGLQQGSLFIILTLIFLNTFFVPLNKGGPDVKVVSCHMNGKIKTEEGTRKKLGLL